jgi:CheY-like chemotaxis protein
MHRDIIDDHTGTLGRILLVDDDPMTLLALPEFLKIRQPNLRIDTYDRAEAALISVQKTPYDAILTDLRMPGMDGLAFLHAAKRVDPAVAVIILSGFARQDVVQEALNGGAYDVLSKPVDREKLAALLSSAITATRSRRRGGVGLSSADDRSGIDVPVVCYQCNGRAAQRTPPLHVQGSVVLHFDCENGHSFHTDAQKIYRSVCDCGKQSD